MVKVSKATIRKKHTIKLEIVNFDLDCIYKKIQLAMPFLCYCRLKKQHAVFCPQLWIVKCLVDFKLTWPVGAAWSLEQMWPFILTLASSDLRTSSVTHCRRSAGEKRRFTTWCLSLTALPLRSSYSYRKICSRLESWVSL